MVTGIRSEIGLLSSRDIGVREDRSDNGYRQGRQQKERLLHVHVGSSHSPNRTRLKAIRNEVTLPHNGGIQPHKVTSANFRGA